MTTGFLYDDETVIQELFGDTNIAAVKAHLIAGGLDTTLLRIEGNDGLGLHGLLGDANGNTVMLADSSQQVTASYSYDPYGLTTVDGAEGNTQQYSGRENDNPGDPRGLYYYRARYYMPGIARFLSEDPIGWTSEQTNNYAYVGGNPISFRGPFGLSAADNFENYSAGFGDALTFGLSRWLRGALGINGVNTCSGWYAGGWITGFVAVIIATEVAAAEGAGAAGAEFAPKAIDLNKLNHIFGKASHNLAQLLKEFGGSQVAAFRAIEAAAQAAVTAAGITGKIDDIVVRVGSSLVTVRGVVIDGIARVGTAWIE